MIKKLKYLLIAFAKSKIKTIRKSRRNTIIALIVLLLLGFGVFKIFAQSSRQPQYQTTQVEKGTLITSVAASGRVSMASNANITTQATGIVKEVYVKNGDFVTAGQTLAILTLDKASQQKAAAAYASYLSAVNNLNSAKAKMNSLQAALFKANQTFVKGAGTQNPITDDPTYIIQRADWLAAESDYNNQQGVISQAQAAISNASLSLSQTSAVITAPISGIISNLILTPGLPITNSTTSTATDMGQTVGSVKLEGANLQASVNITEIDAPKVKLEQKVTMTLDAFLDKTFTGKVSSIDTNGTVSSGVTTYPTVITFDTSPDNIYPNMAVTATIILNVKDNVLLIPSSAIQTQNAQSFVRIMEGDRKITQVNVALGDSNDTQTEIVSGLKEGDVVVTGSISTQNQGTTTSTSPFGAGGGGFRALRGGGGGGAGAMEGH